MPWTTPTTVSSGQVLTAARYNQDTVDNMLMGNPVFTNEAARNAAISSPVEGQRCYLTAPTVPAATGATTAIPSGVTTIYNGSVWVCVTPVSAYTGATGTTTSASYTATLSGSPGTNPSVTLVTGTTALIFISVLASNTTGFADSRTSVAVSGAGTVAASNDWAASDSNNNVTATITNTAVITGLTAGTNTFTLQYAIAAGVTYSVSRRRLMVVGIA
jgi:hypothetical protein